MKTTIVPAQITTVEDKIVGNLTFPQILFLVIPLITTCIIYLIVNPVLHLTIPKLIIIIFQFIIFPPLAIRFKGKTLASHLRTIAIYRRRPRIYIFTKNDIAGRDIETVITQQKEEKIETKDQKEEPCITGENKQDRFELNYLNYRIQISKKGGIDVSFEKSK